MPENKQKKSPVIILKSEFKITLNNQIKYWRINLLLDNWL